MPKINVGKDREVNGSNTLHEKFWAKILVGNNGKTCARTYKPLLWFAKDPRPKVFEFMEDSVESQRPDKTLHPWTQSTDEVMHVVLDQLIGTGTTAIAAIRLNRRFVRIEKNSDALAIARHGISTIISSDQMPQGKMIN
ncbi:MAG: DNA methyltransferase [Candidatus Nitrosopolaris sp.]|jgi:hypothetical protein